MFLQYVIFKKFILAKNMITVNKGKCALDYYENPTYKWTMIILKRIFHKCNSGTINTYLFQYF